MPYISLFSSLFLCMFFFLCLFSSRFSASIIISMYATFSCVEAQRKKKNGKKRELGIGSGIHKFISPVPSCAQLSCVSYYVTTAGMVAGAMITTFMRIMAKYVQREKRSLAARVRNAISSVVKCVREFLWEVFISSFLLRGPVTLRKTLLAILRISFTQQKPSDARSRVFHCAVSIHLLHAMADFAFLSFFFCAKQKKDQNMCINL